jgi:guanylate kinase
MTEDKRKGIMFILSSPSGAGKTTVSKGLLDSDSNLYLSISVTTRKKRSNEIDGKDYYFVSKQGFEQMIKDGLLLEHAEVFGNYYGTPLKQTEELLNKGHDILYDIDWQGTLQLLKSYKENIASIFLLPPSMEILEERLRNRAQDDDATIKKRLDGAKLEISKCESYDYLLVNDKMSKTLKKAKACIEAERNKASRMNLSKVISNLEK